MTRALRHIPLITVLGIIEPIFYFLLITSLSLTKHHYSLIENYISELSSREVAHMRTKNILSFILLGVVVILYSFALNDQLKQHPLGQIAHSLLILSGASLILLGLVPADGRTPTPSLNWHRWLTFPVATSLPAAMICYYFIFKNDIHWRKLWPQFSFLVSTLILITDFLLLTKHPRKYLGITQRLGVGFSLLWIFATSNKAYSLQQHY